MYPQIKICGLTCEEDIRIVNQLPVNYVGFVLFFEKSKRCILIEKAQKLMTNLREDIKTVAVVVSPTIPQIEAIQNSGFDIIQIHGTLDDDVFEHIRIPIFRAINITSEQDIDQIKTINHEKVDCIVLDGSEPGSGKTFNWAYLSNNVDKPVKIMLAGGLNDKNVVAAIKEVNPFIVDVSSSVENASGMGKDMKKVSSFVEAVRSEF